MPAVVIAACPLASLDRLGDAEVHHQGVAAGDHDVVGLHIAVHHAAGVGVGQCVGHFDQDSHRLGHRQLTLAVQPLAERLALDEGHDVVEVAIGLAGIEHREDVRVGELGRDLDFATETVGAQGGRQLGPENLDRHLALVPDVFGEVDRRHAAGPGLANERVPAGECGAQAGADLAHPLLPLGGAGGRGGSGTTQQAKPSDSTAHRRRSSAPCPLPRRDRKGVL